MSRSIKKLTMLAAVASGSVLFAAGMSGCNRPPSAEVLVTEAKQYQQKGDIKAALIQAKNAVAGSPDNAEARLLLGTLHLEAGDGVSAEKELRKAATLGVKPEQVAVLLAKSLLLQGAFQKVVDETASAGANADLLALRGDALYAQEKIVPAQEAYDAALKARPGDATSLLGKARLALAERQPEQATTLVEQAVTAHPKDAEVLVFKGTLLRSIGKNEAALAAYDQALAIKPDHRSANLEKAYLHIATGNYEAAQAAVNAAKKAAPNGLVVVYTQALLDHIQGKNPAALDSLQKVLRAAPEHMPSILLMGAVQFALGSMEQAAQNTKKYLEANPSNVYARKLMAQVLLNTGAPAEASGVLQPALAGDSRDAHLLALAGQAALQTGDFKKATDYFERASAIVPDAGMLHTALGITRMSSGDSERAVSELELGAKLDTKTSRAGLTLVLAEMRLKHFDKALAAVTTLEQQQPKDAVVQNVKGGVYLAKGDQAKARAAFERALVLQPNFLGAAANLAQLDMKDNKPEDAKQRFQAILDKEPKNFGAANALADIAIFQRKPEEATVLLEKAVAANPELVTAAIRLSGHYMRTGQAQKALTLARKTQVANSGNVELLDLLGQVQLATNDPSGALETYSKLVSLLPKSAAAQLRMANVNLLLKNEAAALDHLNKTIALDPANLDALMLQADITLRKGDPERALAIAEQLKKAKPENAAGYMLQGTVLLAQNKPALAIAPLEKALALGKSGAIMAKLHSALDRAGKTQDADARMAQWMKAVPSDDVAPLYMAELAIGKKQYKNAIALLEPVNKRNPKNVPALNNLAWCYQQEKDARAQATAEQALALAPDNPSVLDTTGWILIEKGDAARALPMFEKALAKSPAASEIRYHYAVGLNKAGKKSEAKKELGTVLGGAPFAYTEEARSLLKQL